MGRGPPDLQADAKQGVEFEREVVAKVTEGAGLGLVGGDGWRDGLLGFAVDELAKVEGSGGCLVSPRILSILQGITRTL